MQTKRLDRTARNAFQPLALINVLDKESRFLFIQFNTIGYGRRRFCLTDNNRTDKTFALGLHQACYIVVHIN